MSRVWRGSELALPRSHRDDLPRLGSKAARGPVGPAQRAAAAAPRAWAALDHEGAGVDSAFGPLGGGACAV